jgi:hypothetical protein
MTEAEWLACDDPRSMLEFLRGRASVRKVRLFACDFCRRNWARFTDQRLRSAVEAAERSAEGQVSREELEATFAEARDAYYEPFDRANPRRAPREELPAHLICHMAVLAAAPDLSVRRLMGSASDSLVLEASPEEGPLRCSTLRCLFNPFRPVPADPAWLAWNGGTVRKLSQAIYEERAFDRLPVLADALEDAGCSDSDLLGHLRGPGPHARGCWAVDRLLGKEEGRESP